MSIEDIYRHINGIPTDSIFTTRELLIYGSRSAVDSTLARMVDAQIIFRLARGVFIRDASELPSAFAIVEAKSRAWGTRITRHASHLLNDLRITEGPVQKNLYARIGGTTSFDSVQGRIYMKGISTKKMCLTETFIGQVIYALWYLGYWVCHEGHVALATSTFVNEDREELRLAGSVIPAWLNTLCLPFFGRRKPVVRPDRPPIKSSWLF